MKFLRFLKHNSRYLCKLFIWTNFFVFLYLMIHLRDEPSIHTNLLEKEGVAKLLSDEALSQNSHLKYKFKGFKSESWNETQKYVLEDKNVSYFK